METKLIVGLGNPGKKYEKTRHNIGFLTVDQYVEFYGLTYREKFNALMSEHVINNNKIIILKPQSFINLSGQSVSKAVSYYDIELKNIIIIHDDLDLDFGKIKIKTNSSSGGHNGIKDIINHLNTKEFARIKMGIKSKYNHNTKDFVLSEFSKDEKIYLDEFMNNAVEILKDFENNDIITLQNKYN